MQLLLGLMTLGAHLSVCLLHKLQGIQQPAHHTMLFMCCCYILPQSWTLRSSRGCCPPLESLQVGMTQLHAVARQESIQF